VIAPAIRQIQRVEDLPKEAFVLYGDTWSRPHYHPIDRVVMVMGGTMWIGTGPSGDKTRTVGLTKGGFIRDIAASTTMGPGTIRCGFQIAGVGPTATINSVKVGAKHKQSVRCLHADTRDPCHAKGRLAARPLPLCRDHRADTRGLPPAV
jgi:hypothetical protein